MRPILTPGLRLLWRDATTAQLGIEPRHAVVVEGVDDGMDAVLRLLDGTRDEAGVVAAAVASGVAAERTTALLDLLAGAGALGDAAVAPSVVPAAARARLGPDLTSLALLSTASSACSRDAAAALDRRAGACVLVAGAGRVGALAASLLAAAGVGRLLLRDDVLAAASDAVPGGCAAGDEGVPRVLAAAEAVRAAGAGAVDAARRPPDADDFRAADVAVLAPDGWLAPPPALLDMLGETGLPYVLAGVRETAGVVGPFVFPGRTACSRCLDLARADADPGWPALAAQLATGAAGTPAACDVTLAAAVAAVAAGQVLGHVSDPRTVPAATSATLELRLPEWAMRRRTWAAHVACRCGAAVREAAG